MQANIKIQIITFILHTVIRTFIHSSAAGIYVNVFHMSHIGKLTGLGSIAGAIFSLIMDPLMKLVQGPLEGNPYWVSRSILELVPDDRVVNWYSSDCTITDAAIILNFS